MWAATWVSRAQKGVFLDTPEWKAGVAKVAAGISAGKAVRIVMSRGRNSASDTNSALP
jgi:hypothetical protein